MFQESNEKIGMLAYVEHNDIKGKATYMKPKRIYRLIDIHEKTN